MDSLLSYNPIFGKKTIVFLLIILFFITVALRFYKLSIIPQGLYQDETAIGYNAYSVLQTGKDEYGIKLPLYFKSFGDYKMPAYIYTVALFEKVFGLNELAVRLPSAILGSFAVFLLAYLVWSMTQNMALSLISGYLLAINPLHVFFSRAAFEVNSALTYVLLATVLFLVGINNKKTLFMYMSTLFFGLALYSYNVMRIFVPMLMVALIVLCWDKFNVLTKDNKTKFFLGLFLFGIIFPMVFSIFSKSSLSAPQSALITSKDIVVKNIEMRSYLQDMNQIFVKVFYNKYLYMISQYFQNIALIISGSFFYISGTANGNQTLGNVGIFHLFELPLFITGLIIFFRIRHKKLKLFFSWMTICVLILALSKEVPHATRGFSLIIPEVVFAALGLLYIMSYVRTLPKLFRIVSYGIGCFVLINSVQFFLVSYMYRFPAVYARSWRTTDKQLGLWLMQNSQKYKSIIIHDGVDFIYTSLLFYTHFPPQDFLSSVERAKSSDLLTRATKFGEYEYKPIEWGRDLTVPNRLIITSQNVIPQGVPIYKFFFEPTKQIVLSVNEKIVQMPLSESRFVLIQTNDYIGLKKKPPLTQ